MSYLRKIYMILVHNYNENNPKAIFIDDTVLPEGVIS